MERVKLLNKETGKIEYGYELVTPDGFKELNGVKLRKFKRDIFKDEEMSEKLNNDDYEIIPWEPFELFGVECDKGWYKLLTPIFDYITEYNKDKHEEEHMKITQIKEKYANLCVYLNFYNEEVEKLIEAAEKEAEETCELCGSKEDVGVASEGWLTTECHECMKKWCNEHERPHRWRRNSDNKLYWILPGNAEDELFTEKEP